MRGVAALVVLALCLAPIAAGQTGKAQSVTVVSPIANPVNVKPVGTVPVSGNVGITEPVRVTGPLGGPVPVTGRVGISGPVTGTVGISGSPSVNVANATAASPLSVRTLTREPINLAGYGVTGEQCTIELFDVPPGKRLVVEQVTSEVYVSTAPPLVFAPVKLYNGASLVNQITGQTHVVSYSLEPKRLAGSYLRIP